MGYRGALEAAGAEVLVYKTFGSYQGDWWAKVKFNGNEYWVHGSFGSCSGCDSFQAQFDYEPERCEVHRYSYSELGFVCEGCEEASGDYKTRLAAFGERYLTANEYTQEEAEKAAAEDIDWDEDVPAMLQFIRDNAIEVVDAAY